MEQRATILVVDDTPANVRLLEAILEEQRYAVLTASSGIEALEVVRDREVDLVLLDIHMPGMNGHEVCRRIREAEPTRLLPIVMVTAGIDESTALAIDAGADDFVVRPFDHGELLARVRSLLRIKELHDRVESQAVELSDLNRELQVRVDEQLEELLRLRRLQRFLSPQLAEVVLSAGDETLLEPHRREIAVVFCDLRGFTRFAGTAEPEELLDVIRQFHAVLGDLVARHGATVGHFAGDGVMLFFNDPLPCPDPALRAVTLGVELRDACGALAAEWHRRGHELGVGLGISLGFATLATIGFEGRYDYSAMGTVVNQAARLCSAAAPGEILVGPRAFAAVEAQVVAEQRDAVEAKGFADPVQAWAVMDLRAVDDSGAIAAVGRTEVRVLGSVDVLVGGVPVELAAKERALVALLAAGANRVVSSERLIDDLWDGSPPESAATSLRVHVSRVRKALAAAGADAIIVTRAPGYVLQTEPTIVDAGRFEALSAAARMQLNDGDPGAAAELAREALSLWRGAALADVPDAPSVGPEAARLEELRLATAEDLADAELRRGRHAEVIGELQRLARANPLRERLWAHLMVALYRTGRQADALRAFQELRELLADEVGLSPSPELCRLEEAILAQDPRLDLVAG